MQRFIGAAFVFGLLAAVGCGGPSGTGTGPNKGSAIVGTWEASDPAMPKMTVAATFTADGKMSVEMVMEGMPKDPNVKIEGLKQEGTYKLEDKTLTVTIEGKEKKDTVKELTAEKMVLTNSEGKDITFTKKK